VKPSLYAVQFALVQELRTADHRKTLRHLVDHFLDVYRAEHKALCGRHPTQERDGFICCFPGFWKRVTESDHIKLKSQGGSDDLWNRICLCAMHHRIAKHLGLARIWGKAPDDVWFQMGNRIWNEERLVRVLEGG